MGEGTGMTDEHVLGASFLLGASAHLAALRRTDVAVFCSFVF